MGIHGSPFGSGTAPRAPGVRERAVDHAQLQMSATAMRLTLKVWRQAGPDATGRFETYVASDVSPDMSFLEMLDVVNEGLTEGGQAPIAFDHDCREGICGTCGMMIN